MCPASTPSLYQSLSGSGFYLKYFCEQILQHKDILVDTVFLWTIFGTKNAHTGWFFLLAPPWKCLLTGTLQICMDWHPPKLCWNHVHVHAFRGCQFEHSNFFECGGCQSWTLGLLSETQRGVVLNFRLKSQQKTSQKQTNSGRESLKCMKELIFWSW